MIEQYKMIMRMAKNDFKARYAASMLGIVWAFVQPLVTVLVFWYVFQMGFKSPPVENIPYILWFVAAYVPWIYFSDMLNFGVNSLMDYSYLVKKVKFKVEWLPVVRIISSLFVHIFFLAFIFFMFGCYKFSVDIYCIQALYYTAALTVFSWGLIMLFSALSVFFKDISQIVAIILQIGFWITPIFWNKNVIRMLSVANVLKLNPLYYVVEGFRESFIYKIPFWSHPIQTAYFWADTLILGVVGWKIFKKLRPHFADEL